MAEDDIQALIDEWGEGNVQAAFWLQEHIKETGLDGIGFMMAARNRLRAHGEDTAEQTIEGEMEKRY